MSRYAVIDQTTKTVTNVVEIEAGATWAPPEGHVIRKSDIANPGDRWDGRKFVRPSPVPAEPTERDLYAAATSDKARLEVVARKLNLI